jgi:hypothetical protein
MKEKSIKSVKITEDIWFYPCKKSFEFTVWQKVNGVKQAVLFKLTHSKIKKYLPPEIITKASYSGGNLSSGDLPLKAEVNN